MSLTIFLETSDFALGIFLFSCLVILVSLLVGIIFTVQKESKSAKIAFIVFGVSLLIGLGSCGLFWSTFTFALDTK